MTLFDYFGGLMWGIAVLTVKGVKWLRKWGW